MTNKELIDHFAGLSMPYAYELWKSYFFSKEMENERKHMLNKGEYFDFDEYMDLIAECSYLMADKMMEARKNYFEAIELNLNDLELTNRTRNALTNNDILTIKQISNLTKKDLSYLPNLGLKGVNEIIDSLAKYNLKLKKE